MKSHHGVTNHAEGGVLIRSYPYESTIHDYPATSGRVNADDVIMNRGGCGRLPVAAAPATDDRRFARHRPGRGGAARLAGSAAADN
jgi:hypothetical protein